MDAEVLQEVLYVFDRRGQRSKGVEKVTDLLNALGEVIPVGTDEVRVALRLLGEYPAISHRDAIHAAVAMTHGLEGIVTTDRALGLVAGLTRFDPAELAARG
jgi:predicted nucleic acid-binding protein